VKRIVVTGGSIAGLTAAQSLRTQRIDGQVTILPDEEPEGTAP